MATDPPTRDELGPGVTVRIVQENEAREDAIVGDVRTVLTEEHSHPGGMRVELESGAVGRVIEVAPEE